MKTINSYSRCLVYNGPNQEVTLLKCRNKRKSYNKRICTNILHQHISCINPIPLWLRHPETVTLKASTREMDLLKKDITYIICTAGVPNIDQGHL